MRRVFILDGYVDEPTCLGVPPYISPYPRYIAGAAWDFDCQTLVSYATIDQIRNKNALLETASKSDILVVIAGMAVPGRYLSGLPVSPQELLTYLSSISQPIKILCGPAARYGFGTSGGKSVTETEIVKNVFDIIATGDGELIVSELLKNKLNKEKIDPSLCRHLPKEIQNFAVKGAQIITQHPFFPEYLITEIVFHGSGYGAHGE